MAPIYRAEQTSLSFSSEPGDAGYLDYISTSSLLGWTGGTLNGAHTPGSRTITFANVSGGTLAVDDYIRLGAAGTGNLEVRKVASLDSYNGTAATGSIIVDYPIGFYHASGDSVVEIDRTAAISGTSLVTFLPGVYETVSTPDMSPEIVPHYFLGTASNRNFFTAYRGRQAFNGALSNFILLNGYPLRFAIGRVRTTRATEVAASTLNGNHFKGQRAIVVAAASTYVNGDYVTIEQGGTNPEVRQIISGGTTTTLVLNYPLMFDHDSGRNVHRATAGVFTHTITETFELDSLTWHLHMRDSGETAANDLIRRWVGGKVSRMELAASEGELLRCSWDVQFLDTLHNQRFSSNVGGGTTDITKHSRALFNPAGVGGDIPHSGGVFGTPTFPTTEPYYFSQGSISFFGVEFARIRGFRLDVNNNVNPYYYINDVSTTRTPAELVEQRREYRLSASVALPDTFAATATTRSLFKELLLEGNYGSGMAGFDVSLTFTRASGTDDIVITIPPVTAAVGGDSQGVYIVRAPHNIGTDSPIQAELDMLFRSMNIVIRDSAAVYP